MEKLNCIIIEDQIPAQETLISYIEQVPTLKFLDAFISPLEAINVIENTRVDILFLDIHLPKLSGIELLKALKIPPNTILTTAFSQYAVEGFNLDVVDYLLKPFSFDRFLKAISKIKINDITPQKEEKLNQLFVKSKGQIKKIEVPSIEYIEAKGDFVLISTKNNREIANISLQKLAEILDLNFVRCHKSYIININFIDKIMGNIIVVNNQKIPIGRSYKVNLMARLKTI